MVGSLMGLGPGRRVSIWRHAGLSLFCTPNLWELPICQRLRLSGRLVRGLQAREASLTGESFTVSSFASVG